MKATRANPLVVMFLVLAGGMLASAALMDSEWLQFVQQFGKNYTSRAEEAFRRSIVSQRKAYIDLFNAQQQQLSGMPRREMGLNHMSDLTDEEFRKQKLGAVLLGDQERGQQGEQVQAGASPNEDRQYIQQIIDGPGEVPDEIDWRRYPNRVTPVKDQGQCGACWAFATTGVLEGQQTKVGFNRLVSLSEQDLVDCDKNNNNHGCGGGYMDRAMKHIKEVNGIMGEQSYPYEEAEGQCRFDASRVSMRVGGSAVIWEMDEGELKKLVGKYGPVAVGLHTPDSFQNHRSGIYWDNECYAKDSTIDHAVLIVGYGTDEDGFDYWIIKNSWNTWWGEQGYAKMWRNGNGHCRITVGPTIPRL